MIRALLLLVVGVQAALGVQTINTCQCGVKGLPDEGSPGGPAPGGSEGFWSRANPVQGNRIVDGQPAYRYQFPWQARVIPRYRNGSQFLCGGTLINNRYVITAAHCVPEGNVVSAEVTLGDINTREDEHDELRMTVPSANILNHPSFNFPQNAPENEIRFDLSLLKLPQAVDLARWAGKISPACLPQQGDDDAGKVAIASGWGSTEGPETEVLLYTEMETANCPVGIHPSVLCAMPGWPGTNTCVGDSGGPLLTENRNGRYALVGTVSGGPVGVPCSTYQQTKYGKVTFILPWIQQNMEQNVVYCS